MCYDHSTCAMAIVWTMYGVSWLHVWIDKGGGPGGRSPQVWKEGFGSREVSQYRWGAARVCRAVWSADWQAPLGDAGRFGRFRGPPIFPTGGNNGQPGKNWNQAKTFHCRAKFGNREFTNNRIISGTWPGSQNQLRFLASGQYININIIYICIYIHI